MQDYPLVSVVLTTWNRKAELELTLQEVMKQHHPSFEVIVVDNHSTDGTVEMVRKEFPQVRLIEMPAPTYGPCEAMNIGFANALGEYIVVVDDDSIPEYGAIGSAIRALQRDPKLAVVAGRILNHWTSEPWALNRLPSCEECTEWYTFVGCGAVLRASVLGLVGGYAKDYVTYENETELSMRIVLAGYRVVFGPRVVFRHRVSPQARVSNRGMYYGVRNNLWFARQYLRVWALDLIPGILASYLWYALKGRCVGGYVRGLKDGLSPLPKGLVRHRVADETVLVRFYPYYQQHAFTSLVHRLRSRYRCLPAVSKGGVDP